MLEKIIDFNKIDTTLIIILTLAGISLFLYGVSLMSIGLKKLAGQKMKEMISKSTSTTLKGIITGTIITALVQSSTGVSVLTVGLVGAGLMTLKQSVGVIMGANIGTTLTSLIIGLPVSKYGLPLVAIGLIVISIIKHKKINNLGSVIAGIGMVFFGLELVGIGMNTLSTNPSVANLFHLFSDTSNPLFWLFGLLFGVAFTAIAQSSTLSIALLQKAYALNIGGITLMGAMPMLLGFGIGTTFSSVFASMGQNKDSKRVSIIYIMFNIFGSIIFLLLLHPYTILILKLQEVFFPTNRMITLGLAYALQNVLTVIILYFFVDKMVNLSKKIIKDKKEKTEEFQFNEDFYGESPSISLTYAKGGIVYMGNQAKQLLTTTISYTEKNDADLYVKGLEIEKNLNIYNEKIYNYLLKIVNGTDINENDSKKLSKYLDIVKNLEKIGDNLTFIITNFKQRYEENKLISESGMSDLKKYLTFINKMFDKTLETFDLEDEEQALLVKKDNEKVNELEKQYRYNYLERLKKGEAKLAIDSSFASVLSSLKGIGNYLYNIADTILNPLKAPE